MSEQLRLFPSIAATFKPPEIVMTCLPTTREIEVIQHKSDGLCNRQIARKMGVSLSTVKWYIKDSHQRLGTQSIAELVKVLTKRGLID